MVELKNKTVTPKRNRRCVWCGELCIAGEPARYRVYKFDRAFQTDYMHLECYDAMSASDWRSIDPFGEGWEEGMFQRGKLAEECEV